MKETAELLVGAYCSNELDLRDNSPVKFSFSLVQDIKELKMDDEIQRKMFLRHVKELAGMAEAEIESLEEFEELIQMMEM